MIRTYAFLYSQLAPRSGHYRITMTEIKNLRDFLDWCDQCYGITPDSRFSLDPVSRPMFFRGHRKVSWDLIPSVFRDYKKGKNSFKERELVLDYKQTFVAECDHVPHIERILIEMQHHLIPTRLLDWSISPLLALFFACQDSIDKDNDELRTLSDGKIYALNPWKVYGEMKEKAGATLPTEHFEILKKARMLMALEWEREEIQNYVSRVYSYHIGIEELTLPLPIVGRYMDNRVRAQQGCFVVWGEEKDRLDDFPEYERNIEAARIPGGCKAGIIQELARMGVNEFVLFPDREGFKKMTSAYGGIFRTK